MRKLSLRLIPFLLALLLFSAAAYPWGSITHAYIADKIGKTFGLRNINEIYGSMVPDLFNYRFDLQEPLITYLRGLTHGIPPANEDFLRVWSQAEWLLYEKALAYGYVSHNDVWGADSVAHYRSITFGGGKGYVIYKAEPLKAYLQSYLQTNYGVSFDDYVAMEFAHNLVEAAGDILIKRNERGIGGQIITASLLRSSEIVSLLTRAFGAEYKDLIKATEQEFRKTMILYGSAFVPDDEEEIIRLLAAQMAELARAFLQAVNFPIPERLNRDLEAVSQLMIKEAIKRIEGDYMNEIRATISYVERELLRRWIFYL